MIDIYYFGNDNYKNDLKNRGKVITPIYLFTDIFNMENLIYIYCK